MTLIKIAHITTINMSLRYLLLNQLNSLQQAGYETVGISSPGLNVSVIETAGIRHIPVQMTRSPFTPVQDLKALYQLYLIFRRERFTIVHSHNPKPGFLAQIAAKMADVPIIVNTLHGFYFHDHMNSALCRFYITLEKIAAGCSDVILSQNREDIETAIRERICPSEKIKYLGNGIDVFRFNPASLSPKDISHKRLELEMPNGTRVVGFVGRLVREKGLLELFAAARIVREQIPNVRFLIIGPLDSEKRDALTLNTAQGYNIADICHFPGMCQDMPELYSLMDLFVLPSHREGFPRSPMEASAMKVPCIATNIRGCREAVEHDRNGLLVPLNDVQDLAEAIVELLTNREKARSMGEEGRKMALERFDEQLVFEKVKTEYARLLLEKGLLTSDASLLSTELPI
jgi:glycosyltransferase involved in cell wall biosynthesis